MTGAETQLKQAVQTCLSGLQIARGDTLFLHSDAIVVAQFPGAETAAKIHALLDALEEFLGPEGTLVLPTFTYSFTKGEVFDRRSTPSTVGMITEIFRLRPGVVRNADPIFSMAASGAAREEFAQTSGRECFGSESTFALLRRRNAWIAGFGCIFNTTFVHYVEKCFGVDYRFEKSFPGTLVDTDGSNRQTEASYYVRDLNRKSDSNLGRLRQRLVQANAFATADLGRVRAWAVRAGQFEEQAAALLRENGAALIEEGAQT